MGVKPGQAAIVPVSIAAQEQLFTQSNQEVALAE